MKASNKVLVVMALAVIFCIWGHPASAGNPDQQTVTSPCVDVYDLYGDQFENCFGVSSDPAKTGDSNLDRCINDFYACEATCNAQRVSDETACSTISDPVEQANCLALADLNEQLCIHSCSADLQAGWCP